MLPIIVEMRVPEGWRKTVLRFASELRELFGDRLLRVIALPNPEDGVYESNVLVVLEGADQEDVMRVMEVAVSVDERLNPLVVDEEDEEAVRMFLRAGGRDVKVTEG
ncbi:MAG: hypothetical protein QI199_08010 [Candidatus Korarchaeota archaeon]|nr:hypothetical protein [Candidatus Korarchaeota archaeon]